MGSWGISRGIWNGLCGLKILGAKLPSGCLWKLQSRIGKEVNNRNSLTIWFASHLYLANCFALTREHVSLQSSFPPTACCNHGTLGRWKPNQFTFSLHTNGDRCILPCNPVNELSHLLPYCLFSSVPRMDGIQLVCY